MKVESYIRILFGGARSHFCRNINTMPPLLSDTSLRVGRVAVIGAGPCGLAAAKYGTYAQTTLRVTGISANENQVSKGRKEVLNKKEHGGLLWMQHWAVKAGGDMVRIQKVARGVN